MSMRFPTRAPMAAVGAPLRCISAGAKRWLTGRPPGHRAALQVPAVWPELSGASGVGICADHRSQRVRGIGVMRYVLGLSYGGVADALAALGWAGSKRSIYRDVQAAGEAVQRLRRQQAVRRAHIASADATDVICRGEQVTVALDAQAGDVLEVDLVDGESVAALRPFLTQLQMEFGIEALISDDQDSDKVLSDELGMEHGVCRTHVHRNVADWVAHLSEQLLCLPQAMLPSVKRSVANALADSEYVQQLIALRPPDGGQQLNHLLKHYRGPRRHDRGSKPA